MSIDDAEWSSRCRYWHKNSSSQDAPRLKRQKNKRPLILAGYGVLLKIEGGSLAIRDGFTHYPQRQETYRYFKGGLDLPDRIILLDCSGSISFDVLSWLAEQNIPLVQINWKGEITCVGTSGYSANPYRFRWQIETREFIERRLEFGCSIISQKIENSISTLEKSIPRGKYWSNAFETANFVLAKLKEGQPKTITELRALESKAAAAYFRAWQGIPINWKGTNRRPIPDSWKFIEQRRSPHNLNASRNAAHPVNAILNYGYAVLQSQLQIKAVADGYDPTIGIMHEGRNGSSAFIFDLMEPERPKVDRKVLEFVKGNTFDPADFTIRSDGVCRLNPEMARVVVATV